MQSRFSSLKCKHSNSQAEAADHEGAGVWKRGGIWNAIATVKEWQHEMRDRFSGKQHDCLLWWIKLPGQKICQPTDIEWCYWYRDMSCFKFQLKMLIIRTDSLRGAVGFHPKVKLPPPLRVSGVHDTWSEVGPRQIRSHKVWKLRKRPSLLKLLLWLQWLAHHVCVLVLVCEKCSRWGALDQSADGRQVDQLGSCEALRWATALSRLHHAALPWNSP